MFRTIRKATAVAACSALALIAPTVIPAPIGVSASIAYTGCVTQGPMATFGSAYAVPAPCVVAGPPSPVAPALVAVGVASVMTNAAIVWRTQCRELTSREALFSTFLPVIGWLFVENASKCGH